MVPAGRGDLRGVGGRVRLEQVEQHAHRAAGAAQQRLVVLVEALEPGLRVGHPPQRLLNFFRHRGLRVSGIGPADLAARAGHSGEPGAAHLRLGDVVIQGANLPADALLLGDAPAHSFEVQGDEIGARFGQRLRKGIEQRQTPLKQLPVAFAFAVHWFCPFTVAARSPFPASHCVRRLTRLPPFIAAVFFARSGTTRA